MNHRQRVSLVLALLCFAAAVILAAMVAGAQTTNNELRNSSDAKMAPRSLLLTGGPLDSKRGVYVVGFPFPNECVEIPPVKATSRSMAIYKAVSLGGFTLLPSEGGLTVWTIEEWEALKKKAWYPEFARKRAEDCSSKSPTSEQQVRAYYHVLTLDYNPQQPPETRYAVYVGDVEHGRLIGQGASPAEAWRAAWAQIGGKR